MDPWHPHAPHQDHRAPALGAPTNVDRILEPGASELAEQITKDPDVFDFLRIEPGHVERELEQALVERIIETLGELGSGFSFVGRQVPFDVDGDEYFVDLLFFHIEQLHYVVVELKGGKFKPEYAGQLGFFVELVEDQLRRPPMGQQSVSCYAPTRMTAWCATRLRVATNPSRSPAMTSSPQLNVPRCPQKTPSHAR